MLGFATLANATSYPVLCVMNEKPRDRDHVLQFVRFGHPIRDQATIQLTFNEPMCPKGVAISITPFGSRDETSRTSAQIAVRIGEPALIWLRAPEELIQMSVGMGGKDGKVRLERYPGVSLSQGFKGLTLVPARAPFENEVFYSISGRHEIHIAVAETCEAVVSVYHELEHVRRHLLGLPWRHDQPGVTVAINAVEADARANCIASLGDGRGRADSPDKRGDF